MRFHVIDTRARRGGQRTEGAQLINNGREDFTLRERDLPAAKIFPIR